MNAPAAKAIEPARVPFPFVSYDLEGVPLPLAQVPLRIGSILAPLASFHAGEETHLARVSFPIAATDPLLWLSQQGSPAARIAWSNRERERFVVGLGVADELRIPTPEATAASMELLRRRLELAPESIRYFGGLRFAMERAAEGPWEAFGVGWWLLPRLCLEAGPRSCRMSVHFAFSQQQPLQPQLQAFVEQCQQLKWELSAAALPLATRSQSREDRPTRAAWLAAIDQAQAQMDGGELSKIVLARRSDFSSPSSPESWLQGLARHTQHTHLFLFQPEADVAFVGASPERLYARDGRQLHSEALAGTRPRGHDEGEDRRLGEELLHSLKERKEQAYVSEQLLEHFAGLCSEVHCQASPSLRKLRELQHLQSPIRGVLKPQIHDLDILATLHPTPAVGGTPRAEALRQIASLEPFDRGWYAGPVGWIGRDAAEFAVAIRSGLLHRGALSLYTGAGILRSSDPLKEWQEIDYKLRPFLQSQEEDR